MSRCTATVIRSAPAAETAKHATESTEAARASFRAGTNLDIGFRVQPVFVLLGLVLSDFALFYQAVEIIVKSLIPHFLLGLGKGLGKFLGVDSHVSVLLVDGSHFIQQGGEIGRN